MRIVSIVIPLMGKGIIASKHYYPLFVLFEPAGGYGFGVGEEADAVFP